MFLRTEISPGRKLIGKRRTMSLAENTTRELFQSFMLRRNEILHKTGPDTCCAQIYPSGFFESVNPATPFEKWGAAEVTDFNTVPAEMETLIIPEGLYAVFLFKGRASEASGFFRHIFGTWFPASEYLVDERPHFEILGEKYKNDSPDSEEEVWIPVKLKSISA